MKVRQSMSKPVAVFALSAAVALSGVASASYFRVAVGTNAIGYGGGGFGCLTGLSGNNYYCPVPDNDQIASWSTATVTVNYQNSNHTQAAYGCWSYPSSLGGGCGTSTANNCPNAGVCSYTIDSSGWASNSTAYKWIEFADLTVGAVIAGYTITD
jgi:hypothetical protein